jgi:hypothetical protein
MCLHIYAIRDYQDTRVVQCIPDHNITVMQILDYNANSTTYERHLLIAYMKEQYQLSKLSSCVVKNTMLQTAKVSGNYFQIPYVQTHGINGRLCLTWFEGYGSFSVTLISRMLDGEDRKPYSFDLMKDVQNDEVLSKYSHQAPFYCWVTHENSQLCYHVVTVLWDKTYLNRPVILYRVLQQRTYGFKLRKVLQKTLAIYDVQYVYFGGVQQSSKLFWNVDPENEEFPIKVSNMRDVKGNKLLTEPPVPIMSVSKTDMYYIGMKGLKASFIHMDAANHSLQLHICDHDFRCIDTVRKCVEKWITMTLRPPKTLHAHDPGGVGYQTVAKKYANGL